MLYLGLSCCPTAALTKLVKLCIVEADFPSSNWAQKATGFESYQRRSGSTAPLFGNLVNKIKNYRITCEEPVRVIPVPNK